MMTASRMSLYFWKCYYWVSSPLLKDQIEDLERKKSELYFLQIGLFIRFIFQKLSHDNCGINWLAVVSNTIPLQQLTFVSDWYFIRCKLERIKKTTCYCQSISKDHERTLIKEVHIRGSHNYMALGSEG